MRHWPGSLLGILSRASTWLRYHQEMHIFSSSIVSQASLIPTLSNWDSLPVSSYAVTVVNTLISFGLLLLYMPSYRIWDWNPPFRAPKTIISVYFLSNFFLVVMPFFPPASRTYEKLPYWVRYVYSFIFAYEGLRTLIHFFTFLSRTLSVASLWYSLASYIGIYGVPGSLKGKDIIFSESGLLMGKMVFLDTYSAEYLGLCYQTLLLKYRHRYALLNTSFKTRHLKSSSCSYIVRRVRIIAFSAVKWKDCSSNPSTSDYLVLYASTKPPRDCSLQK